MCTRAPAGHTVAARLLSAPSSVASQAETESITKNSLTQTGISTSEMAKVNPQSLASNAWVVSSVFALLHLAKHQNVEC